VTQSISRWRRRPRRRLFSSAGQWRSACSTAILGGSGVVYGIQLLLRDEAKVAVRIGGVALALVSLMVLVALALYVGRPATDPDPKW
jgi:hypothetical protein